MKRVDFSVLAYSSRPNLSEAVEGGQPLGTVYQCSETPLISHAQVCFFHALHHGLGPLGVRRARAHGDLQHLVLAALRGIHVQHEAAVYLHQAHVIVGRHRAAAVPALVADAEKADLISFRMPVGGTFFGKSRWRGGGHVLQPLGRLLR